MTIKDVIVSALRRIGREDIALDIEDGGTPAGDDGEVVQTLLYCVNATEDELARYYFPLKYTETLRSEKGVYEYSSFAFTPVRILEVKSGGAKIRFFQDINFFQADSPEIEVTYLYTPKKKTIEEESAFGDMADGNLTALGAAAEYCLICGEVSLAEVWESRYHAAIDRARKTASLPAYIPPRRWV